MDGYIHLLFWHGITQIYLSKLAPFYYFLLILPLLMAEYLNICWFSDPCSNVILNQHEIIFQYLLISNKPLLIIFDEFEYFRTWAGAILDFARSGSRFFTSDALKCYFWTHVYNMKVLWIQCRPSVCSSVTQSSQNWFISFFYFFAWS